jgi:hypothetical protein
MGPVATGGSSQEQVADGCSAEWQLPGLGRTSVLRQAAGFEGMQLFWWRRHGVFCRYPPRQGKWCRGWRLLRGYEHEEAVP